MADVTLTPHDLAGTGGKVLAMQTVDTSDEYLFLNDGRTLLLVENGAGANDITLHSDVVLDGLTLPDKTVNLAANSRRVVGPFPTSVWNNDDGKVRIEGDAATIKLAVFRY